MGGGDMVFEALSGNSVVSLKCFLFFIINTLSKENNDIQLGDLKIRANEREPLTGIGFKKLHLFMNE
jgi:hypothetical protein